MNHLSRRTFLKLGGTGLAGSAFINTSGQDHQEENTHILKRKLGNTGINLPVISIGKLPIDNDRLVKAIFESGVVHIDSAHSYHQGKNDKKIGDMLKLYKRSNYLLSTKIKMDTDPETGQYRADVKVEDFIVKLNESLSSMNVDYVDILYLHMPPGKEGALDSRMLKALSIAKKEGKAKHIGVSTHSKMPEVIEAAIESDLYEIVLTTYNYQLDNMDVMQEMINKAAQKGIGVIAMKTQAGKYLDKEKTQPVNSSAAVKWSLQEPNISTALVSIRSYTDLETYKELLHNIDLTPHEQKDLAGNLAQKNSLFCDGCGQCVDNCPYNIAIPDLMRAYMYLYGYKDLNMARETLDQAILSSGSDCTDCGNCNQKCPKRFNIPEKIADVKRLKDVPHEFIG